MKISKVTEKDFNFPRIALVAFMLMLFDGVVIGAPGIGFLVTFFGILLYIGYGVWYYFRDKKISGLYLKKAGVFLVAFCGIVVLYKGNEYVGMKNAKVVVEAVQDFHLKNATFPNTLDELVPAYIEELPSCAYRINTCKYWYRNDGEELVMLMWEEAPPFGRRTYDFKTDEWGYVD